jgi:hypothetical protein
MASEAMTNGLRPLYPPFPATYVFGNTLPTRIRSDDLKPTAWDWISAAHNHRKHRRSHCGATSSVATTSMVVAGNGVGVGVGKDRAGGSRRGYRGRPPLLRQQYRVDAVSRTGAITSIADVPMVVTVPGPENAASTDDKRESGGQIDGGDDGSSSDVGSNTAPTAASTCHARDDDVASGGDHLLGAAGAAAVVAVVGVGEEIAGSGIVDIGTTVPDIVANVPRLATPCDGSRQWSGVDIVPGLKHTKGSRTPRHFKWTAAHIRRAAATRLRNFWDYLTPKRVFDADAVVVSVTTLRLHLVAARHLNDDDDDDEDANASLYLAAGPVNKSIDEEAPSLSPTTY